MLFIHCIIIWLELLNIGTTTTVLTFLPLQIILICLGSSSSMLIITWVRKFYVLFKYPYMNTLYQRAYISYRIGY